MLAEESLGGSVRSVSLSRQLIVGCGFQAQFRYSLFISIPKD
jgi:hypothetical protein